ncbi:MAG: DUF72 domain-containing protein [Chloroflexi bacterium]|nr:DUF72 domain-containing protein [Chloroflexota bacterium]
MRTACFVGTSGWVYPHWRGPFYPQGLPQTLWLKYYAQHFSTVELNNSFYRLPSEAAFQRWRDSTPGGFVFTVKASRLITHYKKLRNVTEALENFLARARLLGPKLGPVLYQLPPNLKRNHELLDAFLAGLPRDVPAVFEFREASWFHDETFSLLRRYGAGFCIMDLVGLPCPFVVTTDFAYVRFHGPAGYYTGSYPDRELAGWADRIRGISQDLSAVYVYFNNDVGGAAVANARTLGTMLGSRTT